MRESLGGGSGENSKGFREEEAARDFPADSEAMADLRLGREQGLRTFPVAVAIGCSQKFCHSRSRPKSFWVGIVLGFIMMKWMVLYTIMCLMSSTGICFVA